MRNEYRITTRLSAAEHRQLVQLSSELNLTQSEAIRACIATRFRYEDLVSELIAIRADIDDLRVSNERVARLEAERILTWLREHVDA